MGKPRTRRRARMPSRPEAVPGRVAAIDIDEEQRRHLIECCAIFRALRFREIAPGQYRKQDLLAARAAIDKVVRPVRRKRKR
jgi:hypothetical protein